MKNKYILATIFALAFLLRFINLGSYDLWRDEAFSANLAQKSISEILTITARDTQPPLHTIALHFIGEPFGYNEFSLRLVSFVAGMISLVFIYKIGKKLFVRPGAEILFLIVNVINPVLIFYSQEARPYSMLIMFVTATVYFALRLDLKSKARFLNYLLLILTGIAGVYTSTLYIIFLGIFWPAYYLYTRKRKDLIKLSIMYAVVFVSYLPWVMVTLGQAQMVTNNGFWLTFDPLNSTWMTLYAFFVGEVNWNDQLQYNLMLIINVLATIFMIWGIKEEFQSRRMKVFFSGFVFLGLVLVGIISFKIPFFYVRYMSFVVPFLLGILIVPYDYLHSKTKIIYFVLLLVFVVSSFFLSLSSVVLNPSRKEGYREAVKSIDFNAKTDLIIHRDALAIHGFRYYSTFPSYIRTSVDLPFYQGLAILTPADYFVEDIKSYQRIWTVDLEADPEYHAKILESGFILIKSNTYTGNLIVNQYLNAN